MTAKPPLPRWFAGLLIRPEVRYDQALTRQFKPFEQNTSRNRWMLGLDVVLAFEPNHVLSTEYREGAGTFPVR